MLRGSYSVNRHRSRSRQEPFSLAPSGTSSQFACGSSRLADLWRVPQVGRNAAATLRLK